MTIRFEQVKPRYLEAVKIESSEVWNKPIDIKQGKHLHIVAPSGRGKTSLIHFLYGIRKDYDGNILMDDRAIRDLSIEDLSSLRSSKVSIIFQDLRLFPEHSAFQNIEVKRALNPFHASSRIREMAGMLGIEAKLEKPLRTCSYGEQQRIAIIRALQQPFDVLLMDEPFSHLDEQNRQIAMQLISDEAVQRNATLILADLKKIDYFQADQILHL